MRARVRERSSRAKNEVLKLLKVFESLKLRQSSALLSSLVPRRRKKRVFGDCPFLDTVPLEVREIIYHYALLFPDDSDAAVREGHVLPPLDRLRILSKTDPTLAHWGTEAMTRLFRVSRQIYVEALQVFFKNFEFSFPPRFNRTLIDRAFLPMLSLRQWTWIRRLHLKIGVGELGSLQIDGSRTCLRPGCQYLARMLKGLRSVVIDLSFTYPERGFGFDFDDIGMNTFMLISIFRHVKITVRNRDAHTYRGERDLIMRGIFLYVEFYLNGDCPDLSTRTT